MSSFLTQSETLRNAPSFSGVESFLDQFIDAVLLYDEEERIVKVNRPASLLFNLPADRLVGRTVWEFIRCESEKILLVDDELRRLFGFESSWRLDCSAVCEGGAIKPLSLTISRIRVDGSLYGCMLMRDISPWVSLFRKIRDDEEAFHTLFEHFGNPLVILTFPAGIVRLINRSAEETTGFQREDIGGRDQPFFTPDDFVTILSAASSEAKGIAPLKVTVMQKGGGTFPALLEARLLTLYGEKVIYCTFKDLTETVRLEEEARSIQAHLIYVNKMTSLGLLVAGISHEINNPNNYILANAEILKGMSADIVRFLDTVADQDDARRFAGLPVDALKTTLPHMIDAILDGSRRIGSIVAELKDYARRGRESKSLNDLNQIIDSALLLVGHQIGRFTDRFEFRRSPDPVYVYCSPQQIEQVVINVILNALESLEERDQGVSLETGVDGEGERAFLTVTDEGGGIAPEDAERVFEPFFTTRLDRGGTGLGLSISQSIIRRHDGEIVIESQPGKGTRVTVSLPLGQHVER